MSQYSYFTKKQANIIYRAYKLGELQVSKKMISKMYNIVNTVWDDLCYEDKNLRFCLEDAIKWYLEGNVEFAQSCIDGKRPEYKIVRYDKRIATDEDWWCEPGEVIEEPVYDYVI